MNPILTELGVPEAVQAFFKTEELHFSYGDNFECFGTGLHRVPTTRNLWLAGNDLTREVIITSGAMEAIAYTTINQHRYRRLENLAFIAVGNLPDMAQLTWIRTNYPKRKFTLVFSNDLLGRLTDIKVGAGLRNHAVRFTKSGGGIVIYYHDKTLAFDHDTVSLNTFEQAAGIRTGIRTAKAQSFETYLDQLKFYANQRTHT